MSVAVEGTMGNTVSFVVPVFLNVESLPEVLKRLASLQDRLSLQVEAIFVVDGSPDDSYGYLRMALSDVPFKSQLILHSRNFGAFSAISSGLSIATGEIVAVMSADLQEPESLYDEAIPCLLNGDVDVVVATRSGRNDSPYSRVWSRTFWALYRSVVQRGMPAGGVDVFVVRKHVASVLSSLSESHTSLVGLLIWLGYRRQEISYVRQKREFGKSAWSLSKRVTYAGDSLFAFSRLPVQLLMIIGVLSTVFALPTTLFVVVARATGRIDVPGYTPLMFVMLSMFSVLIFSLSIVASYVWRTFENSKSRPGAVVADRKSFDGAKR